MSKIYILHENDDWMGPFRSSLLAAKVPFEEWHMASKNIDFQSFPPGGIYYNRMSASAHTRGHRSAPEYTAGVLSWLGVHGCRVVNGSQALDLELSKLRQYQALQKQGIQTPKTWAARNITELRALAQDIQPPFITKHNRGGKGLGVHLFQDKIALAQAIDTNKLEFPIDGIYLIQEYIQSQEPYIVRCEFISGKFVYAVKVNNENGFQLCPADDCQLDESFCPTTETGVNRFTIIERFDEPLLIKRYEAFLKENAIEVAGIEFITDIDGRHWTYDVNTNTNYNRAAEESANKSAPQTLAIFLGSLLHAYLNHQSRPAKLNC